MKHRICKHCDKYIFDSQNISVKKMTTGEYAAGVVNREKRTNASPNEQARLLGFTTMSEVCVNKADCELCGAPHAIFSLNGKVTDAKFFFSGSNIPDQQDKKFIEDFRRRFFSS
jgi:hypothetical protein